MAANRPLLTGHNVSRMAEEVLGRGKMRGQAKKAKKDKVKRGWKGFVQDEFQLSRVQRRNLSRIPEHQVERVQQALNVAADQGGRVEFKLGSETGGPGELVIMIP